MQKNQKHHPTSKQLLSSGCETPNPPFIIKIFFVFLAFFIRLHFVVSCDKWKDHLMGYEVWWSVEVLSRPCHELLQAWHTSCLKGPLGLKAVNHRVTSSQHGGGGHRIIFGWILQLKRFEVRWGLKLVTNFPTRWNYITHISTFWCHSRFHDSWWHQKSFCTSLFYSCPSTATRNH